jgi:hypothetical protein
VTCRPDFSPRALSRPSRCRCHAKVLLVGLTTLPGIRRRYAFGLGAKWEGANQKLDNGGQILAFSNKEQPDKITRIILVAQVVPPLFRMPTVFFAPFLRPDRPLLAPALPHTGILTSPQPWGDGARRVVLLRSPRPSSLSRILRRQFRYPSTGGGGRGEGRWI